MKFAVTVFFILHIYYTIFFYKNQIRFLIGDKIFIAIPKRWWLLCFLIFRQAFSTKCPIPIAIFTEVTWCIVEGSLPQIYVNASSGLIIVFITPLWCRWRDSNPPCIVPKTIASFRWATPTYRKSFLCFLILSSISAAITFLNRMTIWTQNL